MIFVLSLLCALVFSFQGDDEPITFGSIIKLKHANSKFYLHSHEITWGSGSGLQSITAMSENTDTNSLWQINECTKCKDKLAGTPVKCGSKVRLQHTRTAKNLHSHEEHKAPISSRQEVCGFGNDGKGRDGDDWKVVCSQKTSKYWIRSENISLT
eukprot:UN00381